jgi:hypothetical protein
MTPFNNFKAFMICLDIVGVLGGVCSAESMANGCSNSVLGISASSSSLIVFFNLMAYKACSEIEFARASLVE